MRKTCTSIWILAILIIGCNYQEMNRRAIMVKGCIIDSATREPVSNAKVTLLCWYRLAWDKTDYVFVDTVADPHGCFSAIFDEGYKVVIAGIAETYHPNLSESGEITNNSIEINLELERRSDTLNKSSSINLRNYIVQNSTN